ncbi:phosphopantetheine-binding protein [Sorangium sp. So ce341]|uniref:phosphopantetheine-binding protein n=1 Tax=Sorangium sp. So ce341 TaxID=3133302 RepID=UPI003F60D3D1
MSLNSEVGAQSSGQVADQAQQAEDLEPKSPSETYLASLWAEIIGLKKVLLPHKFLEVGGNSLTLNVILNRVEAEKGASLEAPLFFDEERSSLFDLAKHLDAVLARKAEQSQ